MIKLVGLKRIIFILILFAVNAVVLCTYLFGLDPMFEQSQTQLRTLESQISELSSKISNIKQDMAYLKENTPKYQDLKDKGLFYEQDRLTVNRLLGEMRNRDALSGFSYVVEDIKEVPNTDAVAMGYRLARSRVSVKVSSAPLDTNVYLFAQDVASSFAGHTYIKTFNIKRVAEVNEMNLRDIAAGKRIGFVNADIVFDWLSLMPKPADQPPAANGGSAAPSGFRGR